MKKFRKFTVAVFVSSLLLCWEDAGKRVLMKCRGMPGRWGPPVLRTQ